MRGGLLHVGGVAGTVVAVAFCAPSAQAQWRLGSPDLTVGQDTASFFEDVVEVIVREDRIYVADSGLRRILAFDRSTGQPTATVGRRGAGPGEFRFLSWIGDCGGDTIFAWDSGQRRISRFSQDLAHTRTSRLEGAALELTWTALKCAGPGTFVGITRNADPSLSRGRAIPMDKMWRATSDFVLLEPDGSLRSVLGTFLGEERYREAHPDGTGFSDYALIWGLRPVFASSPQGFVVGTGEGSSLVRYDVDGNVLDTLALGEDRVVISRVHVDANVQSRIERAESRGLDIPSTRSFWQEYPYPSHFPAYRRALMTANGFVWVERFPEPYTEQPRHWKVFTPDGTLAATVDVPRGFELMWVDETHVAGIVTDELGVQTVEVRPIQRT